MVEPDRGLVEHVEHAAETEAGELRQAEAVRFTARDRRGWAIEGQVAQAEGLQHVAAGDHLRGDRRLNSIFVMGSDPISQASLISGGQESSQVVD